MMRFIGVLCLLLTSCGQRSERDDKRDTFAYPIRGCVITKISDPLHFGTKDIILHVTDNMGRHWQVCENAHDRNGVEYKVGQTYDRLTGETK